MAHKRGAKGGRVRGNRDVW